MPVRRGNGRCRRFIPDRMSTRAFERNGPWNTMTGGGVQDQLVAFLPNLRRFAISLCRSRELADDLVQMACERALANAATGSRRARASTPGCSASCRNLWIDEVRKRKTAGPQEDIEAQDDLVGVSGERETEARLTLKSVAEAIDGLVRGAARGAAAGLRRGAFLQGGGRGARRADRHGDEPAGAGAQESRRGGRNIRAAGTFCRRQRGKDDDRPRPFPTRC